MRPFVASALALCLAGCQCGPRLTRVPEGLTVQPDAIDFGAHPPGTHAERTVTLTNGGKIDLALVAHVDDDLRIAFTTSADAVQIPAGAQVELTLGWTAGPSAGDDTATLTLEAPEGTVAVPLHGRVLEGLEPGGTGGGTGGGAGGGSGGGAACPGGVAELSCGDGVDNDCDGKTDCDDSDCAGVGACAPPVCDPAGELRLSTNAPGISSATAPDVAWNGSEFLVSWISALGAGGADLSLSRLSASGAVLSGPTAVTSGGSAAHPPRLATAGSDWVVAFSGSVGATTQLALLQYVDAQGALSGAPLQLGQGWPVTASSKPGTTDLGVLWGAKGSVGNRPSFTPVAAKARAGADLTVSPTSGNTDYGDLAWNGGGWASVWTDLRMGQSNTYFARLDAQGYPQGTELLLSAGTGWVFQPRIAWTGTEYGVSWSEWSTSANTQNIFFARVSAAGALLAPAQQVTHSTGAASSADLAWTGTRYAIVYMDDAGVAPSLGHGYLLLLDPQGQPVGVPRRFDCGAAGSGHRPAVAWNGSALAIAWGDTRGGPLDVYFRLLVP